MATDEAGTGATTGDLELPTAATPGPRRWLRRLLRVGASVALGVTALLVGLAQAQWPLRVTAPCVILVADRGFVRPAFDAVIATVEVDEGSRVKRGDLLATLEASELTADLARTRADLQRVIALKGELEAGVRPEQVSQLQTALSSRRSDLAFATRAHQRLLELVRMQVASQDQLTRARREQDLAQRSVEEAEARLALLRAGSRPEEIEAYSKAVEKLEAEEQFIVDRLAQAQIRAPIDGMVVTRRFREKRGHFAKAGEVIAELIDPAGTLAEVYVGENLTRLLALGQPLVIRTVVEPDRAVRGKVAQISPVAEVRNGRRIVRVEATLETVQLVLRPNVSGWAEIDAGRRSLLEIVKLRIDAWLLPGFFF